MNVIHITGTKGKGSTSAFTSSILHEARPDWKIGAWPFLAALSMLTVYQDCIPLLIWLLYENAFALMGTLYQKKSLPNSSSKFGTSSMP